MNHHTDKRITAFLNNDKTYLQSALLNPSNTSQMHSFGQYSLLNPLPTNTS